MNRRPVWWLPLLCLLGALPALARAQSVAPFLWEVEGPQARHYLLGSVHLLPEAAAQLPDGLEQAYVRSAELMFESDIGALSKPDMQVRLLTAARAEKPLKAVIAPALYERLVRRAAEAQMPMTTCEAFRPWYCALMLEIFLNPYPGVDKTFYERALTDEKPVRWLEEPQAHLTLFTQMPEAQSEQVLAATVDELTDAGRRFADLRQLWQDGDAAQIEKMTTELQAKAPAVYERLLAARNRAWLPKLQSAFDGDKVQLVIVGAGHLYGADGLVALLREKGYRLQPAAGPTPPAETPQPVPAAPPPLARLRLR